MIKRVLLLSSLMLSVPTWAATQPAAESAPVAKASDTATTATTVAAQGANALKESDGKDIIARDPKPDTGNAEHDALLVERRQQQRMVLARLAASRGGDPTFNEKKNQAMLEQMRGLQADYDRQLDKAQADLDAIDVRLAKFSGN